MHTIHPPDGSCWVFVLVMHPMQLVDYLPSWVTNNLVLPRGMLHGMDIDGDPIPIEELGSVYVKYSTQQVGP